MWIVWPLDGRGGPTFCSTIQVSFVITVFRSYFSFIISETEAIFVESLIAYCNPPATLSSKPSSIQYSMLILFRKRVEEWDLLWNISLRYVLSR
uniref:Putative ovule protein n=1 Tax=Solanum chacoense TaxID=4108 RepID=A0A0V0H3G6_SOLCH